MQYLSVLASAKSTAIRCLTVFITLCIHNWECFNKGVLLYSTLQSKTKFAIIQITLNTDMGDDEETQTKLL